MGMTIYMKNSTVFCIDGRITSFDYFNMFGVNSVR